MEASEGIILERATLVTCQQIFGLVVEDSMLLTVHDPDRLAGLLQSTRDRPHISTAINVPLDIVLNPLGGKTAITMLRRVMQLIVALRAVMCMAVNLAKSLYSLGDLGPEIMDYPM